MSVRSSAVACTLPTQMAAREKQGPVTHREAVAGHDAWVVGDEAMVAFEFESAETFAKG